MKEKIIVYYRYEKKGKIKFKIFNDFEKAYSFYEKIDSICFDTHLAYYVRIK